ncbi:hypothetical protein CPB83DRAFT_853947 [Crepidotus variabilis]|uniref:Uncharacterized protein n=1 Tax=Crepidotus variabilis TaxID=179855 RepID=A0A9P6E8I5_9AGAR|nr:hypothetical protein CPB83DRAFT_861364 [Crepidotus variabilis]KAF9528611.1 hypothetical protein CPB83DRAFT_853947 [Crepidotus variabilis]
MEEDLERPSERQSTSLKIPLCELFDWNRPYWVTMSKEASMRTLNEELELHSLLDLDANEDPDDVEDENDISYATL